MEFTFFYSGPFSQWHTCSFTVDDIEYNRAEQYMMQQKAILFNDLATSKKIMEANTPYEQKALGRDVKNFIRHEWEKVARDIVYKGNYHKFKQNPDLMCSLEKTKGTIVVEASPKDLIWGIGLAATDHRAKNMDTWRGKNWLGQVLTKVRDDLLNGVCSTSFEWDKT